LDPADLADVEMPVLIVNAANEFVGSPEEVAAAIPGARLVIIPDTDHLTVVPDRRFKDAVVAFLKERDRGA
jgi:pimeloyl-ACP methyl ester carboxylesterase